MIGNHQDGVTNGHGSSLLAPTGGESAVLSREVSVPRTTSGMRRLHYDYYPDTFQTRRPAAPQWGSDSYQLRSPPISPPPYAAPLPGSSPIAQVLLPKGASARQSPHSAARWSPRESRCAPVVGQ